MHSSSMAVELSLQRGATHDELFEEAKLVYAKYIQDGFKCLEKLPRTWDNIFPRKV
jgi:hypothetical protein